MALKNGPALRQGLLAFITLQSLVTTFTLFQEEAVTVDKLDLFSWEQFLKKDELKVINC